MKNIRTLTELRAGLKGRIYIYLDNDETCRKFLRKAEDEGYHFGGIKPTESGGSGIIALEKNKQLSFVGFVGHMAFQCNGGSNKGNGFYRIDYRKFIGGDKDYMFKDKPKLQMKGFSGKFYGSVTVIGDAYADAAAYIKKKLADCQTIEEEESLYAAASQDFNVIVIEE